MLETTPTPSTGWTHVALFLLLWIEHPVGTSPQGPWVSQQQTQEPINREFFLDPQNQLSSSHIWTIRLITWMTLKGMHILLYSVQNVIVCSLLNNFN